MTQLDKPHPCQVNHMPYLAWHAKAEKLSYGVTDGDGKYWHHLCHECFLDVSADYFADDLDEVQP